VPRRSGELAASLLQAYAIFPHNIYDAGGTCFSSNVIFDAKERRGQVPYEIRTSGKSPLFHSPSDSGESLPGAPPLAAFSLARSLAALRPADICEGFRNDARSRQFRRSENRKLRKIGENRSERGGGVADQGEPKRCN